MNVVSNEWTISIVYEEETFPSRGCYILIMCCVAYCAFIKIWQKGAIGINTMSLGVLFPKVNAFLNHDHNAPGTGSALHRPDATWGLENQMLAKGWTNGWPWASTAAKPRLKLHPPNAFPYVSAIWHIEQARQAVSPTVSGGSLICWAWRYCRIHTLSFSMFVGVSWESSIEEYPNNCKI